MTSAEPHVRAAVAHLPLGVGNVSVSALCALAAVVTGAIGWWLTGAAVALPLALVGGVALSAAVEDVRTGRIPNGLVLTGIVIVACSWGFVATLDNRMMRPLAVDLLAGLVLGGAPVVFLVWLAAPRLIGGGDWKLLVVLGAMIGALAPASASLMPVAAFGAAIAAAIARHRRHIRLGPFLAAGYLAAIAAAATQPDLFDSWYGGTLTS